MYTCLLKILCLILGNYGICFSFLDLLSIDKFIQYDCCKGHLNKALIDQKHVYFVCLLFIWNWLDERIFF